MNKGIGGINNEIGTEKILIDASIGGNTAVQIMDKTPIRLKKLMKECFLNRIGVDKVFILRFLLCLLFVAECMRSEGL